MSSKRKQTSQESRNRLNESHTSIGNNTHKACHLLTSRSFVAVTLVVFAIFMSCTSPLLLLMLTGRAALPLGTARWLN